MTNIDIMLKNLIFYVTSQGRAQNFFRRGPKLNLRVGFIALTLT